VSLADTNQEAQSSSSCEDARAIQKTRAKRCRMKGSERGTEAIFVHFNPQSTIVGCSMGWMLHNQDVCWDILGSTAVPCKRRGRREPSRGRQV